ncbi:MAG: hypothetical protein CMB20_002975 [Methanobacteriota archaeon]|nr:MAG: hypothetical protein CMB20_002975 [Euryarchaeota archaeon]
MSTYCQNGRLGAMKQLLHLYHQANFLRQLPLFPETMLTSKLY